MKGTFNLTVEARISCGQHWQRKDLQTWGSVKVMPPTPAPMGPLRDVPISWSSMARIWSEADMMTRPSQNTRPTAQTEDAFRLRPAETVDQHGSGDREELRARMKTKEGRMLFFAFSLLSSLHFQLRNQLTSFSNVTRMGKKKAKTTGKRSTFLGQDGFRTLHSNGESRRKIMEKM